MRKKIASALIILSCFVLVWACMKVNEMADLILLNGTIWTGENSRPWAEAVGIKGDKIFLVGSNKDVRNLAGKKTQVLDLRGDLVLPGFIDSHTHFLSGGFSLLSIHLREAKSKREFIARIGEKARELGKGQWIQNGDWDHEQFDPPELPRREWIDSVTPENPVCVNRLDGHMVLVNSLALQIAGINKNTASPEGGEIVKDPKSGEPTGILKDAAMDLVTHHIPEPGLEEKIKATEAALRLAAECGVTSLHEMADSSSFEIYQDLFRKKKLTSRIFLYVPVSQVDLYSRLRLKTPFGNEYLKIGGLKGFVDGSLGSSTALFFEPYTDQPNLVGLLSSDMFPEGIMERRIRAADQAALQTAIHAIGDKANAIILDIFERVIQENGPRDRRWRIEHAQHLRPVDMERMAKLDIIASVQPYHAIDDGRWAENRIGRDRCHTTYAFRTLLDQGVRLAFGSDWTVAPLNPLSGIYAAVTRRTLDGKNPDGWFPEEKISLQEALTGYTLNGAYAEFAEDLKGSLAEGKLADIVILSQNIFNVPAEKIIETRVKTTILGGRIIYQR